MRVFLCFQTGLVVCLAAMPCFAEPCRVEISGEGSDAWQSVAGRLADELEATPHGDCAQIRLELQHDTAYLTFITRDGRSAARELNGPDDLVPTVQALNVTGTRTPERADASSIAPPLSPPEADRAPPTSDAPARASADSSTAFSVLAGARGGESNLMSPVLRGSASLALQRWELGVLGGFDLHYGHVPEAEAPPSEVWAWVAGVSVGRREPIGTVAVLGGGRLLLAALGQASDDETKERGRAEVRLGAYGGLVLPRSAPLRFRADFGAEIVPHDIGAAQDDANRRPMTPWWALSLMLGAELGGS